MARTLFGVKFSYFHSKVQTSCEILSIVCFKIYRITFDTFSGIYFDGSGSTLACRDCKRICDYMLKNSLGFLVFSNIIQIAMKSRTQLIQSFCFNIFICSKSADRFAVNPAFFSKLIHRNTAAFHSSPQAMKDNHLLHLCIYTVWGL